MEKRCMNCIHDSVCGLTRIPSTCKQYEEERPNGKWGKWVISEVRCPECLEYFDTDCFSKEEMKRCPNCNSSMKEEGGGQ